MSTSKTPIIRKRPANGAKKSNGRSFSRAGNAPGVSPGKACATVSIFSSSGMLVFPPSLGALAHRVGLDRALLLVLAMCLLLTLGIWGALRNGTAPSGAGDR